MVDDCLAPISRILAKAKESCLIIDNSSFARLKALFEKFVRIFELKPCCSVPIIFPEPRESKSKSAISKPFEFKSQ